MKKHKVEADAFGELRSRAEQWLGGKYDPSDGECSPEADAARVIHELHVHQIELEMQNEELQRAQSELETNVTRLTQLYEFAPVGYITLDTQGGLLDVNLAGASMFGCDRALLIGRRFAHALAVQTRSAFDSFLAKVFASRTSDIHEISLCPEGAAPRIIELAATVSENGEECLLVATDITRRSQAEHACQELRARLTQLHEAERIGTVAGDIARELNQLFDGIIGHFSLGAQEWRDPKVSMQGLEGTSALVEKGRDLTRRLLELNQRVKWHS